MRYEKEFLEDDSFKSYIHVRECKCDDMIAKHIKDKLLECETNEEALKKAKEMIYNFCDFMFGLLMMDLDYSLQNHIYSKADEKEIHMYTKDYWTEWRELFGIKFIDKILRNSNQEFDTFMKGLVWPRLDLYKKHYKEISKKENLENFELFESAEKSLVKIFKGYTYE